MTRGQRVPSRILLLGAFLGCAGGERERPLRNVGDEVMEDSSSEPEPSVDGPVPEVSFEADLYPLMRSKCSGTGCHGPELGIGGLEPLLLGGPDAATAAEAAEGRINTIIMRTSEGSMPPSGADGLTQAEKQLFSDWKTGGFLP